MPETTLKRKSSQTARRGAHKGKNKPRARRQAGNRAATAHPSIVAHSVYSLTLKAIPGVAVIEKQKDKKRRHSDEDDYEKMYSDLLSCLQHALTLKGETSTFDPLKSGLDLSVSLHYVLQAFKNNILPEGYEVNVDKDNDFGYHFTIFKSVDFPGYWHAFEVKPIIRRIKANWKLHGLFIDVLKCMRSGADIGSWWDGGMGYAEYMLEEEIENWDDNGRYEDEKESMRAFQQAVACQHSYSNGEAKEYQDLISNCIYRKPEDILKDLEGFRRNNKIGNWLKEVCAFLMERGCIQDFIYSEHEDLEGLKFDQQATIVWDVNDEYSTIQGECLDSEAQGIGINDTVINIAITRNLKSLDCKELEERCQWPAKLTKIYESHQELLQSFKPKKNDKRKN